MLLEIGLILINKCRLKGNLQIWSQTLYNFYQKAFIIVNILINLGDKFLLYLNEMKNSPLYKLLKNIPKSVLQHNHFQCNADFDFFKNYIVNDQNLYLNKDKTGFEYGNQT